MIKTADVVERLIRKDRTAIEAVQRGIFNASAYARQIQAAVEEESMKPVQLGTIIVALNRLVSDIRKLPEFTPKIRITNLNITTDIAEVTYEKTIDTVQKMKKLDGALLASREFFTATQGPHEITIICSNSAQAEVKKHFGSKPKMEMEDLVAVSLRISPEYIQIPNVIYTLVSILATQHINLLEIVSTYTELTFIVQKSEMEQTVRVLHVYTLS